MVTRTYTKVNLKKAFWDLYEKKRLEKITVAEICKKAGYNRSTFYDYYSDIFEVLDEIEEELITPDDFQNIILNNVLHGINREAIIQSFLNLFEEKSRYFVVLLGENGDPAFRSKLLKRLSPIMMGMPQCEGPEIRNRILYLMEYQSSGILSTMTKWFQDENPMPREELVELLMSVTIHGVQKEILDTLQQG